MNSICICRVFTKLLLLGAHSVSMKYCSCCLDLGMVQLSISHIGASSHQLLWSQTVILSVPSHLFRLCFLNASHHEYAMSYSPELGNDTCCSLHIHIYIHTHKHTFPYKYIYIYLCILFFSLVRWEQSYSVAMTQSWWNHTDESGAYEKLISLVVEAAAMTYT